MLITASSELAASTWLPLSTALHLCKQASSVLGGSQTCRGRGAQLLRPAMMR